MSTDTHSPEKCQFDGVARAREIVTPGKADGIVAPATPSSIQARSFVPRRRFQKGNIIIRGKTPKRYGMFREDVLQPDGTFKRVRRCIFLGVVSRLSERSARKM